MHRRLIVGYDGSPNSEDALALAMRLCEALEATPVIASCVLFPRYALASGQVEHTLEHDTAPLFERAAGAIAPLPVETRGLCDHSAARALQRLAEEMGALAIVVGSTHHGVVGRVLLGSVGRGLLTGAPCLVAVAPRGDAAEHRDSLKRIGVGMDGGPESERALGEAIELAARSGGRLTLVEALSSPPVGYGAVPGAVARDLERQQREYSADGLERAAQRVPDGVPVSIERPDGDPAEVLAEATRDLDLMLVGSRSYGPTGQVLLGAVSHRLMHRAHCPVAVVPRAGAGWDPA